MIPVRRAAPLLLLCALTASFACGEDEKKEGIDKIRIDGAGEIDEGQTLALKAVALDADGAEYGGVSFTWSSSDPEVASVDVTGLVRAERFGTVTISASTGGVVGKASITIRELPVASLEIAGAPVEIPIDGVRKLEPILRAENGTLLKGRPVEWTSSDASVVEVTQVGEAKGIARGTVELTAKLGGLEARATASVVFRFVRLAAGAIHGCGLTNGGIAWCWGGNDHGELGGDGAETASPRRVASNNEWKEIAAGDSWTCALTRAGAAWCWGDVEGVSAFAAPTMVDVPALRTLAMGDRHACGLTEAGATYCWGKNDHGQLGAGDDAPDASVQALAVAGGHRFESLAAGGSTSCALDDQNRPWCWGSNEHGQLGGGAAGGDSAIPVAVKGDRRFTVIAAGASHACGLEVEGVVWCWGGNDDGQLGRAGGPEVDRVDTQLRFALLVAGSGSTIAVTRDGEGWGWGANHLGQLGAGDAAVHTTPAPIVGKIAWASVVLGREHGTGLATDGLLYSWGGNERSQLGNGTQVPTMYLPSLGDGQKP